MERPGITYRYRRRGPDAAKSVAADALVELESEQSFPASDHRRTDTSETMSPPSSSEIRHERRELTPEIHAAWDAFSERVFVDGAVPAKTKQLLSRGRPGRATAQG